MPKNIIAGKRQEPTADTFKRLGELIAEHGFATVRLGLTYYDPKLKNQPFVGGQHYRMRVFSIPELISLLERIDHAVIQK